ncbi:unnamed protein product [Adineta steineri]|uniref:Uncharacterized protein n=1 Tax=Adineta steineri TaxID=433720 RepID=A0A815W348_9BILA|nr:unnamed protein product [Adineta steineri]CAF1540039.1 unnamed protein product [Adineta steineri]
MGVQNFWQLIESTGRPVNMNKGLEGKILAIDISIWLHQAAKGMRDRQNPHILLLLHRICKLLHFKIKPIFIFDGGVPELKRRTLFLVESLPPIPTDDQEKDLFELPDTHLRSQLVDDDDNDIEGDGDDIIENTELEPVVKLKKQRTTWSRKRPDSNTNYHYVLPKFSDLDDSALNNLPVEMQHEILSDMKEGLKRGRHQVEDMPQKSDDFSDYQVQKLLKQSLVSQKIFNLNKAMKRQKFDIPTESNAKVYAGKLASDASTQYILIKSDTAQKPTPANLSTISSTSSLNSSFSRQSTSDFCADNMMNRDPCSAFTQRRSTTIETDSIIPTNIHESSPIKEQSITTDASQSQLKESPIQRETHFELKKRTPIEKSIIQRTSYEEDIDLELAIQRSLEDQQDSIIKENNDISNIVESSSDSDESDFIDVPVLPKQREPIILPQFENDESHDRIETSHNTTSSEFIELDNDNETSHSSSAAIDDIKMYIEDNREESSVADVEDTKESSFSQLESLEQLQAELIDDTAAQLTTARGNERLTATLTDTMHEDTQYLLRLFGIPYLVSPTEAEAQCAYLDLSNQCDGVITDDSDVWLFGSSHVYRHFFRQDQLVEYYDGTIILNQLGLDRESMIAVGMIVGSDYTKGIPNAGIMTALEILQEFHGTCMERLEKFRRWWKKAQKSDYKTESKVLKRLKNLELFEGFPNKAIYDAYIKPKIDYDQTKFTWAMPQLELIREFIGTKLKWDRRKIDDMILPVIKRMNTKEIQSRIDSFFAPYAFENNSKSYRKNTRLQSAINLLKERTQEAKDTPLENENNDDEDEDDNIPIPEKQPIKKRKRTKNTKLMNNVLDTANKTNRRSKKKITITSPVLSDDDDNS